MTLHAHTAERISPAPAANSQLAQVKHSHTAASTVQFTHKANAFLSIPAAAALRSAFKLAVRCTVTLAHSSLHLSLPHLG